MNKLSLLLVGCGICLYAQQPEQPERVTLQVGDVWHNQEAFSAPASWKTIPGNQDVIKVEQKFGQDNRLDFSVTALKPGNVHFDVKSYGPGANNVIKARTFVFDVQPLKK